MKQPKLWLVTKAKESAQTRAGPDVTLVDAEPPAATPKVGSMTHLLPLKVTPVYDTYWKFAVERQRVFMQRLAGEQPPWTTDRMSESARRFMGW